MTNENNLAKFVLNLIIQRVKSEAENWFSWVVLDFDLRSIIY